MDQYEIANILKEIAVFLELHGENAFKIRAYQNAARTLEQFSDDLAPYVEEERLADLPGIGKAIAEKIAVLFTKGKLPYHTELRESIPKGLLEMLEIPGLGAKRIRTIHDKLGIKTMAQLKKACKNGDLQKLSGFGEKIEQSILDGMAHLAEYSQRYLRYKAAEIGLPLLEQLRKIKGVQAAEICGSFRRGLETVGDLDFLVASSSPAPVMNWFTSLPNVEKIQAKGNTKSSVRFEGGLQADLRVVPKDQYAYALLYFTGSKEHNIKIRHMFREQGLSLSEWGLAPIDEKTKTPFASRKRPVTERDIYRLLDMDEVPPELRQDMGEIEVAQNGELPKLLELKDLRGTFHCHTTESDGKNTLEEMALAAEAYGWDYLGVTDHSQSSVQANGLSPERLLQQVEDIQKLNRSRKTKIHLFAGVECDILSDGSLDYDEEVLNELDFVICSVHSGFKQDESTMTERIIRAIEHPATTMLGHMTGRLLLRREPYALNVQKVIDAAIANDVIIELNCNPWRMDMDWRLWHDARDKGLLCSLNPDAHSVEHFDFMEEGVVIARKGWLRKEDVLNTRTLRQVKAFLKKH